MIWHLRPQCDTGQRIPWFDTCQLTIIWMSIIRLNTGYRPPILARKFDVLHWFPCGEDGQLDRCTVTLLLKFLGWTDNQIFLGVGFHSRVCGTKELKNYRWQKTETGYNNNQNYDPTLNP